MDLNRSLVLVCVLILPRRILNYMKLHPLILAKCWRRSNLFSNYFPLMKGYTRWVIRVSLVLLFLPTFPFAFISSLLVSLVTSLFSFYAGTPHVVALESNRMTFLSKLFRSSLFVRLPALKICLEFTDFCVGLLEILADITSCYLLLWELC